MGNWDRRYIREAGLIDPTQLAPCTGNKNCGTCAHFDELMIKPEKGSKERPTKPLSHKDKTHNQKMQDIKKHHQKARK